ncbi:universal stress protein [Actinoplanes sp. KI2]|uniref:universal stress protein n=1 Tax=Actinoplanes sp. KI2 TaxID=2983315 RepID=UPI0021D5AE30|nr:universal stress protein [Actinoplanes sp. KI2]MCU7729527.1 universal stress protein [Actinoplanes sp. KI2]
MSDLDRLRTERDSRQNYPGTSRYSGAVNRYLGVLGHHPDDPGASVPGRVPSGVVAKTGLVLVGVDDSPISHTAVDHAAIEAELRGWDLRMVHVQGSRQSAQDAGARLLERLTERVRACAPTVAVTSRIVTGAAASRLLVEGRHAGLVVVGHRHGAASSVFGVSVGERVAVDHSGVVMVVRIPGWPPGPGFAARPIVVGVDGDDSPVVGFGHGEARLRGSELVLLHAGRTPRVERVEIFGGVRMHRRFVADDPAAALVEASAGAAALVVGRHGPGGMPAGMLGSVSRAVVQHAHCPVFLVS